MYLYMLSSPTYPTLRYGLVVRIAGSHPAGPGSIPGNGNLLQCFKSKIIEFSFFSLLPPPPPHNKLFRTFALETKMVKVYDEDGIRTHAGRAHWISSPTP